MDPYAPLPRSIALAARSAHLLAMAGYLGGRLAGRDRGSRWRLATTLTGAALLATEISHSRHWPTEGRGLMAIAHIGLLPLGHVHPRAGVPVAIAALLVGAVGSHLPKSIRKWSLVDRHGDGHETSNGHQQQRAHRGTRTGAGGRDRMLELPGSRTQQTGREAETWHTS